MKPPEHIWVVRLPRDRSLQDKCMEEGLAAIGWAKVGDLSKASSREEIAEALRRAHPKWSDDKIQQASVNLYAFSKKLFPGHWVLGWRAGRAPLIGKVSGNYAFAPKAVGTAYPHVIRVKWRREPLPLDRFSEDARRSFLGGLHVYSFDPHLPEVMALLRQEETKPDLDKVLEIAVEAQRRKWKRNETATISKVIRPILEALGWDGWEQIQEEYVIKGPSSVDLALLISGKPVVFVEAKAFGTRFAEDGSEVKQALGYAYEKGVSWAVLTDGVKWWVYSAFAKTSHPEKRIFAVDLLDDSPEATPPSLLGLLTPGAVSSGRLERFALRAHWDHAVRKVLEDPPRELVNLVAERAELEPDADVAREVFARFASHCPPPTND